MSTPRYGSSAVSVSDGIWVIGGRDSNLKVIDSTEFIFLNRSRADGPALPKPRYGHCVVEYGGVVVLMGGTDENGDDQSNVWLFNAKEGMKFIG